MNVAGVDGCKAGWIAAIRTENGDVTLRVVPRFADLLALLPDDATVAVDMPVGLPERTGRGGRGPEALIRPLLGQRQSSVFAIPSRAAVMAEPDPFSTLEAWYAAHRRASAVARETSDPPRAVSIQAFGLFGKIRELDALLRADLAPRGRVVESHPELCFWRLNGERPLGTPKKVRGRVHPPGMEERKRLLGDHDLPRPVLDAPPPRGAGADDALDACAMLVVAERVARGVARSFPSPPAQDGHGLPIAIWV